MLIPSKSKDRYNKAYKEFRDWQLQNNVDVIEESVILAFLYEKVRFIIKSHANKNDYSNKDNVIL